MGFGIKRLGGGHHAVVHHESGEVMHPGAGPWAEARGLYVAGSELPRRLRAANPAPLVLFDVGLGAAANALAALACHEECRAAGGRVRPLHIVSFERDLEPLDLALDQAETLAYSLPYVEALGALREQGHWSRGADITWELRLGDFPQLIQQEERRAEVVYFDPFSPAANGAMWCVPVFEALFACRPAGGEMVLATYSTAYSTRAALLLAGYFVGEGPQGPSARRTTLAATRFGLLSDPLTPAWLRRWQHNRDPWPRGSDPAGRRILRTALADHAQWLQFGEPDQTSRTAPKGPPRRRPQSNRGHTREAEPPTGRRPHAKRSGGRGPPRPR